MPKRHQECKENTVLMSLQTSTLSTLSGAGVYLKWCMIFFPTWNYIKIVVSSFQKTINEEEWAGSIPPIIVITLKVGPLAPGWVRASSLYAKVASLIPRWAHKRSSQ